MSKAGGSAAPRAEGPGNLGAQRHGVDCNAWSAALTKATLDVLMEDARYESLIGNTFS